MTYEIKVKRELIKRYIYIYENKELILSLCINKAIEKKYYQEQLKKINKTRRDAKKYCKDNEDLLKMLDIGEKSYNELLKKPKYYLFDEVNSNIISMYEQFLLTDDDIENTFLYKYIEDLKGNERRLQEAEIKIEGLYQRRNANKFLNNKSPFTVWKILNYVRIKNSNNKCVLEALDKYYNIERYVLTGIDFASGYVLVKSDIENIDNNIDNNKDYLYEDLIIRCRKNEFESEDEYFDTELDINPKIDVSFSSFMGTLKQMKMLSLEEKQKIREKLLSENTKKLVKK